MKENVRMRLNYASPPPKGDTLYEEHATEEGGIWERWTLPLGCGYFGASVYGYTDTERIQITENSVCNPYASLKTLPRTRTNGCYGLTSLAELFIDTGHTDYDDYERELDIDNAVCRVKYTHGDVRYEREFFTSYPDRVLGMRFSSDMCGGVSFLARAEIPYLRNYAMEEGDGFGRCGEVICTGDTITITGTLNYYDIKFDCQLKIICDGGTLATENGGIRVIGANTATMLFACGTNYRLESRVFTEPDPKKKLAPYPHPHNEVTARIRAASAKGYEKIKESHLKDYKKLYSRVKFKLDFEDSGKYTDELLTDYKNGVESRYLEALLFQYGRYLLISSSRVGALPANLQGVWSTYASSPWSAGYWHNINVQMNYWPACVANVPETFLSYADYNVAYMDAAKESADRCIKKNYTETYTAPGTNGWIIGTGGWPYTVEGFDNINHSGPGTGAFTSLLFWDYYDFTRDKEFLQKIGYPALLGMSIFLSKALRDFDGKLLVDPSASPEIVHNGAYYVTRGCAFDQQMVYESHKRTLEAAQALGICDPFLDLIREQMQRLDPVLIGDSGQIKEFREEGRYGEFGEYTHRHVSQLVGMYPGTVINSTTPDWQRAAKVTLTERAGGSSGWSTAHRACLWARLNCGSECMKLLKNLIKKNILQNLWDHHPPFQIDGNFGYTASVCEMLIQSHEGVIRILPAICDEWKNGSFTGLLARGNFTVDCEWENSKPKTVRIYSNIGGRLSVFAEGIESATVTLNGTAIHTAAQPNSPITFETRPTNTLLIEF